MIFPVEIWGTVGQWASSVFSGASLLVALSIVKRDRSKDDWTNSRKIETWTEFNPDTPSDVTVPRTWTLTLVVTNQSDDSIYQVRLVATPRKDVLERFGVDIAGTDPASSSAIEEIHPGENKKVSVNMKGPKGRNELSIADLIDDTVYFEAKNGIVWEKASRGARLRIHNKKFRLSRLVGM